MRDAMTRLHIGNVVASAQIPGMNDNAVERVEDAALAGLDTLDISTAERRNVEETGEVDMATEFARLETA